MRWFWIDRYTEFVSGERATAVKNVSLSEEHLHDHFPGHGVMPNSLVLEGMAGAGGRGRVLVVEGNRLVGIISTTDVTRWIQRVQWIQSLEGRSAAKPRAA